MADFLGMELHVYEITDEEIIDFIPKAVWYMESFDEDCISGIISNCFVSKMIKPYSNAVLVGESLVTAKDIPGKMKELLP